MSPPPYNPISGSLAALGFLGLTATLSPLVILASMRDPRGSDQLLHVWGRESLRVAGVQAQAKGLEKIPARTCVFVSNHQSHFDALLTFTLIRKHIRFVAKKELFRIPLFGQALRAAGNIEVSREGGSGDHATLADAIQQAQERTSVLFYPEGTRSEDGVLRPFRKGAAVFAIQAQMPIVPMGIAGTRDILRKKSLAIHRGCSAALVIGDPIPTEGLNIEDRNTLTERTSRAVAELMAQAETLAEATRRT